MNTTRTLSISLLLAALLGSAAADAGLTREQVRSALTEARSTGDIVVGESSLKLNERSPSSYPAQPQFAGKSRDEVRAELAEARVLGDLQVGEDGRTLAEAFPQRYAAVRAQRASQAQQMAAGQSSKDAAAR